MKRRMIACAVAAVMMSGVVPAFPNVLVHAENYTAGEHESGVNYAQYSDRVIITGTWAEQESYDIPAEINGLPVIEIQRDAFINNPMKSVVIPGSVEVIGMYAFCGCEQLTDLTLSEGIEELANGAFGSCTSLTDVSIPASVTTIGKEAFSGCSELKKLTIADGDLNYIGTNVCTDTALKELTIAGGDECVIETNAFSGLMTLETLNLGDGVTEIREQAFYACYGLTELTIPSSVELIKNQAFAGCIGLEELTFAPGEKDCDMISFAFWGCSSLHTVTIERSLTEIGFKAFMGCTALENVILPETLQSIGESAFADCESLESIDIPDSVTRVTWHSFDNTGLYNAQEGSTMIYVDDWALQCDTDVVKVKIKEGTRGLANAVFADCYSITSLSLPDSLEIIDYAACSALILSELVLPESMKLIDENAFLSSQIGELTILSPDCEIYASSSTVTAGTLMGYEGSTLQEYAETYGYNFVALDETPPTDPTDPDTSTKLTPDINQDGNIDAVDASWILQYAAATGAGYTGTIEDFVAENNA